jgi:hypothetical protein
VPTQQAARFAWQSLATRYRAEYGNTFALIEVP